MPGVEWGLGAVGNAMWRGVRLKDVLAVPTCARRRVEIVLNGADGPVLDGTPDFVKSIPAHKALDDNTLIAYEMNGAPLPHYNGFPIRLIVPGWTATYWMKHLDTIEAWTKPFAGFWMNSAYRIPTGKFPDRPAFPVADDGGERADHRDGGEFDDHRSRRGPHDAGGGDG